MDFDQLGSVDQLNKSQLSMNSGGFDSLNSSGTNLQGFVAMSGDNFSDNHGRKSHPLSFLCLQDGGHDHVFQSFNPIVGHQSSSFYDPLSHLIPTMVETFGVQRDGVDSRVESFLNPDPPSFGPEFIGEIKGHGKKRKKADESVSEKPREVVHVRAKRGEATDSHSLAERMRREKINEKLRRLQDLVPGCYKTMGMSVMLDVIINYVRSLQNQIEFLSMKLSAASMFYDFNSTEMNDISTMKGTNYGQEAQMMERMMVGEGYGDFPGFQSTCPPN